MQCRRSDIFGAIAVVAPTGKFFVRRKNSCVNHFYSPDPFPKLSRLISEASGRRGAGRVKIGVVFPCDEMALRSAEAIRAQGIAALVLIGPRAGIEAAADEAGLRGLDDFELVDTSSGAEGAAYSAHVAVSLARSGRVNALMKGSMHTDVLMAAVVRKVDGLRSNHRISHAFIVDLPTYPKLLCLSDCVVNIAPSVDIKRSILTNAINLLSRMGVPHPKVGVISAMEVVNPAVQSSVDAKVLVDDALSGAWPGAIVEGPFGFDNAISAGAAKTKGMRSKVAGEPDLLIMPDLVCGNVLYKSLKYLSGGDCAGLILGARVPVIMTSRADSQLSRVASAALAGLLNE